MPIELDDYEKWRVEARKLSKPQLWTKLCEESDRQDFANSNKEMAYHFLRSISEGKTISARLDYFFSKSDGSEISWTKGTFKEREKKYRELILSSRLIGSTYMVDFVKAVLEKETVAARIESFYSKNESYSVVVSKEDFRFMEQKHSAFILENKNKAVEDLADEVELADKKPVIDEIKEIELDEIYKRVQSGAPRNPPKRKQKKEPNRVTKDDSFWDTLIMGALALAIGSFIVTCASGAEKEAKKLEDYCEKYYKNYPLRDRRDCERSWQEILDARTR